MLADVTALLRSLLSEQLPSAVAVAVGSDKPDAAQVIQLLLRQVRACPNSPTEFWTEERDATGRVIRRAAGERRFDLWYQVTAWAAGPEQELILLDHVLRLVVARPQLQLASSSTPATLKVDRLHPGPDEPAHTRLDLLVNAPLTPDLPSGVTAPPRELAVGLTPRVERSR